MLSKSPEHKTPINYENVRPSIRRVVQAVLTNGGSYDFQVKDVDQRTLDAARDILADNLDNELPRFHWDVNQRQYIQEGFMVAVEARHADFEQVGNFFEDPKHGPGLSAVLRVAPADRTP